MPVSVPNLGPRTVKRQPTPTNESIKNGPEIVNFRPVLESRATLANRRHFTQLTRHRERPSLAVLVGSPPTPRSTQLANRHDGRLTDVSVSSALLECLFGTRYNRLSLANVNQLLDQDSTVRVEIAPSVSRPTQPYSARRGPRCTRRTNHWFGPIPDVESGLRDLYSAFRCIVPQVWPTLAACKRSAPDRR